MKFVRNSNFFWFKLISHFSFIFLLQIQMFLEDLTDIVRELKRSDTYNSTYIPPSSSWRVSIIFHQKYMSSFKSMNYYIYFFQIKMFVQDLTTITNEIKRMELPGTSIVPPSSSWFQSCSIQCYIFIVLEIKTKTCKNTFIMETGACSFGTIFIIYWYNICSHFTCFEWKFISRFNKILF